MKQDIHGEVAIVTGGSRGLGLLLARELARQVPSWSRPPASCAPVAPR